MGMKTGSRRGRAHSALWIAIGAGVFYIVQAAPARAGVLSAIGKFFGNPLGGFIDSATAPTLQNAEGTADRVVADIDGRVGAQIDHVDGVLNGAIASTGGVIDRSVQKVDDAASARMNQADGILAARIGQVDASAHATIAEAMGDLSTLERNTLKDANKLVVNLDAKVQARLSQVDQILDARVEQVDGVVRGAIALADKDVAARIEQVDEAAQRTVGALDVVATKQSLSIQQALLRVGALLGMVAFLVAALRYVFDHLPSAKGAQSTKPRHHAVVAARSAGWVVAHLAVGAAGIALFLWLSSILPDSLQKQRSQVTDTANNALQSSLAALDFTRVRYYAAQLTILDPANEASHRAVELRADLIRTVLSRPGLLTSSDGVRQLTLQIEDVEHAQELASPGKPAPDVLVIGGYIRWQLARTRLDELDAATSFAHALDAGQSDPQFILKALAARYVLAFLARPVTWSVDADHPYSPADLARLAGSAPGSGPLEEAARYDDLVLSLDRASTTSYLAMLDAHADLVVAIAALGKGSTPKIGAAEDSLAPAAVDVVKAKQLRLEKAKAVIAAWAAFDQSLQTDPELAGSPLAMAAFGLNDAPLAQALWFESHPDAEATAPRIVDEKDPAARAQMMPVRVAWARRYLVPLGSVAENIAGYEEAKRYKANEAQTVSFASNYVAYRVALASNDDPAALAQKRDATALAAAQLGLYGDDGKTRGPLGLSLLDASTRATPATSARRGDVAAANDAVRLRLL
jgi:hypothetical protein